MLKQLVPLMLIWGIPASAHEFWLEPVDYTIERGDKLQAEVRSGEYFKGEEFPYMPERIVNVEVLNSNERFPVDGIAGNLPALSYVADTGFQIMSYQSTASTLTHDDFGGFQNFLREDGLQWVEEAHRERQLPTSNFQESFTRYAKALVSVNNASGRDRATGLPYELVVLSPLYDKASGQSVELQLLAQGSPAVDVQVTVFRKNLGEAAGDEPMKIRTDQDGRVTFAVSEGVEYLASAVLMREGVNVPWHSHWTSVTFAVQ